MLSSLNINSLKSCGLQHGTSFVCVAISQQDIFNGNWVRRMYQGCSSIHPFVYTLISFSLTYMCHASGCMYVFVYLFNIIIFHLSLAQTLPVHSIYSNAWLSAKCAHTHSRKSNLGYTTAKQTYSKHSSSIHSSYTHLHAAQTTQTNGKRFAHAHTYPNTYAYAAQYAVKCEIPLGKFA